MIRTGVSLLGWLLGLSLAIAACAADQATIDKGRKEEQRACLPCHSLRLIHSQRLSRATWNKELDKMAGWGAKYTDREALLEYLVANFGDDKPATPPDMSADGRVR
jgi:hypothetical protein